MKSLPSWGCASSQRNSVPLWAKFVRPADKSSPSSVEAMILLLIGTDANIEPFADLSDISQMGERGRRPVVILLRSEPTFARFPAISWPRSPRGRVWAIVNRTPYRYRGSKVQYRSLCLINPSYG